MKISDAIKDASTNERSIHIQRYVQLLVANQTDPESVSELHSLMKSLGKNAAEVEADAQVVHKAMLWQQRVVAAKGTFTRFKQVEERRKTYPVETEQLLAERKRVQEDLENSSAALSKEYNDAGLAVSELNKLKVSHPEILLFVKPATHADIE